MQIQRHRYLVVLRIDGKLDSIPSDSMDEALRIIADDDYRLGPDGYEAVYDSIGYDERGPTLITGKVLAYDVMEFVAGRRADEGAAA